MTCNQFYLSEILNLRGIAQTIIVRYMVLTNVIVGCWTYWLYMMTTRVDELQAASLLVTYPTLISRRRA